jgi:penicillin G amidase
MRMFSGSALAACSLVALLGSAASAETTKTYRVAGLTAPAEIIVDG